MPSFTDAIRTVGSGLHISCEVQAGARENVFPSGYNSWRETIGISITAPPVDGRANAAIILLIAEVMGVQRSSISIISGVHSNRKVIRIEGMSLSDCIEILHPFFS
ncbi:uncharacterized protein (TIGR00251 family) [Methanocalculus alkaliphilus]|uniref:DUF167 domain-containing protein n=1 Tax=Methanocalculus alkaliphilus TaxID=768730 RepID=UPI00209C7BBF|nr:DUF167 domain-containing protein [Methanocalculus alkaliphilus]MCP1715085.1 uncharacterized protein (TIGR00251 family) [Methanocalculus alkaliphilus]